METLSCLLESGISGNAGRLAFPHGDIRIADADIVTYCVLPAGLHDMTCLNLLPSAFALDGARSEDGGRTESPVFSLLDGHLIFLKGALHITILPDLAPAALRESSSSPGGRYNSGLFHPQPVPFYPYLGKANCILSLIILNEPQYEQGFKVRMAAFFARRVEKRDRRPLWRIAFSLVGTEKRGMVVQLHFPGADSNL